MIDLINRLVAVPQLLEPTHVGRGCTNTAGKGGGGGCSAEINKKSLQREMEGNNSNKGT